MSKNPLLQLREVSRSDNSTGKQLLSSVSLDVCSGDRIGLVGGSGSGKSTLMRAIVMLDHCSGDLFYRGKPISNDAIPSYRREVIYLSQRPFFTDGTVEENLRLPFQFKSSDGNGTGHTFQLDLAADVLNAFELSTQILKQPCESLSGGEQQMLCMCRTLMGDPELIMIDEPTEGLAPKIVEQVANLLKEIANRGVAILLVEQKLSIAFTISHRLYVMGHGQIVYEGTPESLRQADDVRAEWLEV